VILIYLLLVINFQSWLDPLIIISALPGALAGVAWALWVTQTTLSVPALMGAIMSLGVATANSVLIVSFARQRLREIHDRKVAHAVAATGGQALTDGPVLELPAGAVGTGTHTETTLSTGGPVKLEKIAPPPDDPESPAADATEAALSAGTTRLRAVLMTALAMMAGMLPMSLGLGEGGEQNAPVGRAVIGGLLLATLATLFFVPVVFAFFHRKTGVAEPLAPELLESDEHPQLNPPASPALAAH
jgi:Cu/Ag efflux pump CusA